MACDDYCCNHGCNQGRDCPVRAKPIRRTDPGIEGVITIARNGVDRVLELERLLAEERSACSIWRARCIDGSQRSKVLVSVL